MRVAVGYRNTKGESLDDCTARYFDSHDEAPAGVEKFVIDFWPAS